MSAPLLRLFLIDDEPSIRQGLAELFPWEEWGYRVTGIYENGKAALADLRLLRADVVLSDIRMPTMDGITLARHIHDEQLPVRLVFLSAYADFEYAREGLEYGVRDFIVKPLRYENLKETFLKLRKDCFLCGASEAQLQHAAPSVSSQADHYISTHLADASLENAAEHLGISAQTLSRAYKKETSKTFADALLEARMRRAGEMVCTLNLRLFSVAEALGYSNAKNFTRAFHHFYGMTPSEYRKAHIHNG